MRVAGLFAGIGGLELGLERAGFVSECLCEVDPRARAVLATRFPHVVPSPDVRSLDALPRSTEIVTAGFPCQDLSQAGRTAGINGSQSSLVGHVFRLLARHRARWVLLENVTNMLRLDRGAAMQFLVSRFEELGYRWAYRVVDARAFGLPQRRQRVFFLASRDQAPEDVLLRGSHREAWDDDDDRAPAYGFYWTEGNRGVGWAANSVPTLKGGSGLGIPSPPAVWIRGGRAADAFVVPGIEDAEALQGFPRGWTKTDDESAERARWKMVGNAVSVPVAKWIGRRLLAGAEGARQIPATPLASSAAWPSAAFGGPGLPRHAALVTRWPQTKRARELLGMLRDPRPLSARAASGFFDRLEGSSLRVGPPEYRHALAEYCSILGVPRMARSSTPAQASLR